MIKMQQASDLSVINCLNMKITLLECVCSKTFFCFWSQSLLFTRFTHNDAPQSVGDLWTSDQSDTETSTWKHTALTTDIHAPGGIRTHNLSRRAAAELRRRKRGHWDWQWLSYTVHQLTNLILNWIIFKLFYFI